MEAVIAALVNDPMRTAFVAAGVVTGLGAMLFFGLVLFGLSGISGEKLTAPYVILFALLTIAAGVVFGAAPLLIPYVAASPKLWLKRLLVGYLTTATFLLAVAVISQVENYRLWRSKNQSRASSGNTLIPWTWKDTAGNVGVVVLVLPALVIHIVGLLRVVNTMPVWDVVDWFLRLFP